MRAPASTPGPRRRADLADRELDLRPHERADRQVRDLRRVHAGPDRVHRGQIAKIQFGDTYTSRPSSTTSPGWTTATTSRSPGSRWARSPASTCRRTAGRWSRCPWTRASRCPPTPRRPCAGATCSASGSSTSTRASRASRWATATSPPHPRRGRHRRPHPEPRRRGQRRRPRAVQPAHHRHRRGPDGNEARVTELLEGAGTLLGRSAERQDTIGGLLEDFDTVSVLWPAGTPRSAPWSRT